MNVVSHRSRQKRNRGGRSWFLGLLVIITPPPPSSSSSITTDFGIVPVEKKPAHSCKSDTLRLQKTSLTFHMTTRFYILWCPLYSLHCYKNVQNNILLCLSAKRYIRKEFQKSRALHECLPPLHPPTAAPWSVLPPPPPHSKITGPFTGPPINNQQKQFYSHRQIAAVFQLWL